MLFIKLKKGRFRVMYNDEVVKLYEKEIEMILATMGTFIGKSICNTNPDKIKDDRDFIISHMMRIKSGNVDRESLEKAVDNLLPYLYENNTGESI